MTKVIGSIGLNAAGKDAVVNYLERRYGLPTLSMGDIVRDIAREKGLSTTRDNLHEVSQECFRRYGRDVFARELVKRIESLEAGVVAVTGVRSPDDVRALRSHFTDFLLVHVSVEDPAIRFARSRKRDEPRDPDTYQQFLTQDREERDIFRLDEAIDMADITIDNSGSLEDLHGQIDARLAGLLADVSKGAHPDLRE